MCIVGMRDSDAFYSTVAQALGKKELLEVEKSQFAHSYMKLMKEVPGHFASQGDLRKRMRRQPGSKPDQADGEAANAPDIKSVRTTKSKKKKLESTAAEAAASAAHVQSFQPAYVPVSLCNQSSLSQPARDWHYGYQDCNGLWHIASAVSTDEDFVQVEPNQAAKDPLNGAMIRRLFGDRWYGAQVMSIHEKLSTGDWWYTVRYQDGTTEILQDYIVQQGVQDLHGPPPPHADPGTLEQHYYTEHADNSRIPIPSFVGKPSKVQNDVESENTDEDGHPLEGIEEEHTSDLQEYLAAALKEALRLRSGLEPLVVTGDAASTTELAFESDSNGQDEQRFHQRLSALTDTLNTELASLTPFKTNLWLGSAYS